MHLSAPKLQVGHEAQKELAIATPSTIPITVGKEAFKGDPQRLQGSSRSQAAPWMSI